MHRQAQGIIVTRGELEHLYTLLKHTQNECFLTREEARESTVRYLEVLDELQKKNETLEELRHVLEHLLVERTASLEASQKALEHETLKKRKIEGELRKLEERIKQAQKLECLGVLAGGVAHDFNNLLMAIMGYTEMALDEIPQDQDAHRYLCEVLQGVFSAKDLVKQILNFSRQGECEPKPLQINLIVKEAVKLLSATLPSYIIIEENLNGVAGKVIADPTQIHQVVINLCTNGAHAMQEQGGILAVSLTEVHLDEDLPAELITLQPGPYVKLCVNDTGCGMTEDVLKKVFDPFFTTKPATQGTGLGLAVVHGIVEQLHGEVLVETEPGKGTTFSVYFPLVQCDMVCEIDALEDSCPHGNEMILLVDDDTCLAELGREVLESLGYRVIVAHNGIEALDLYKARAARYDLVITDYMMPGLTGTQLASNLLGIRPEQPIMLFTGYSESVTAEVAAAMGIRKFVEKPITREDLAKAIRECLDHHTNEASL